MCKQYSERWTNEVRLLFWKLPVEVFIFTNLEHAKRSNDLVLKSLRPFIRPFCRVKWVRV
jgi:hypothetical protein